MKNGRFHTSAFREVLLKQKTAGKAIVLLNFPNNPTGYTPHLNEVEEIISALSEAAQEGMNLVVILDDAYFGLFYEDSVKESLFGRLAGLHPRILPVKVDGATKEKLCLGIKGWFLSHMPAQALLYWMHWSRKTKGIIRGTISSSAHLSQTIILKIPRIRGV
ncbi:hypothetical protein GCM10020331_065100 [Ectobacillus funiculus]